MNFKAISHYLHVFSIILLKEENEDSVGGKNISFSSVRSSSSYLLGTFIKLLGKDSVDEMNSSMKSLRIYFLYFLKL